MRPLTAALFMMLVLSNATKGATEEKDKKLMNADPERLKKVPVVLRVKLDRPLGGETGVSWYRVKVLSVLKNDSKQKFGDSLDVSTYVKKFGPGNSKVAGVPPEECTLYLEPLRDTGYWALLGGSAVEGVSHVAKAPK